MQEVLTVLLAAGSLVSPNCARGSKKVRGVWVLHAESPVLARVAAISGSQLPETSR